MTTRSKHQLSYVGSCLPIGDDFLNGFAVAGAVGANNGATQIGGGEQFSGRLT
jgi:hypothetical protein